LTYAYDAIQRVSQGQSWSADLGRDAAVMAGAIVLSLVLGATTLRRRTP